MFFRMGIIMLVQLYTSRVVLNALGIEDYGIFNVVCSFIIAFTFFSGPLDAATQRFLSFELGKGDQNRLKAVFNISFYIYFAFAVVLVAIVEIVGLWYLHNRMELPAGRINAAEWAFHFSLLSLVFGLLKTPFDALVVAHEKMSFYAYASIADVMLKLGNAFSLQFIACDKLKIYAVNQLVISLVVFTIVAIYCRRKFVTVNITWIKQVWDITVLKKLLGFSGWSLFGSVVTISANQGLNILLNSFFGVFVNAAMGVATQVSVAVNQFSNNFQMAYRPQLVKYYATENLDALRKLVLNTSKYSYLLLFAVVCPIVFNIDYLLKIWLKNVPEEAPIFCVYLLVWQLIECLMAPMWTAVNATGRIKKYHLVTDPIIFSVIVLSYISLKLGFPAYSVVLIKCIVDIVLLVVRLIFVKRMVGFEIKKYLRDTLFPISMISMVCISFLFFLNSHLKGDFQRLVVDTLSFALVYAVVVYLGGLKREEREKIVHFVKSKLLG
jgi:O-antigen/teichoic acid export membrane protein